MHPTSTFVLRHSFVILASSFVILTAWWLAKAPAPSVQSVSSAPPTSTSTDPAEVFQKAFWKRPTSEDRILKAERREWSDHDGLKKWSWHLSVQPSPALVDHLITQNAFMLTRTEKPAPAGFTLTEATHHFTSRSGTFHLLWDKNKNLLQATDSGTGFRPGAPEPVRAVAGTQPAGRLPTTPPPNPQ